MTSFDIFLTYISLNLLTVFKFSFAISLGILIASVAAFISSADEHGTISEEIKKQPVTGFWIRNSFLYALVFFVLLILTPSKKDMVTVKMIPMILQKQELSKSQLVLLQGYLHYLTSDKKSKTCGK